MEIAEILTSALAGFIVSSVLVITQVAKMYITERWIPLFGFLLGALLTFTIFGFNTSVIIPAILIAGAGLGIYDLGKRSILNK